MKHQLVIQSKSAPVLELTKTGLYLRFLSGAEIAKTIVRNEWPHIAVDVTAEGAVVGIEATPLPESFSLGAILKDAGIKAPRFDGAALKINRQDVPVCV
jgi:hypothetical protein